MKNEDRHHLLICLERGQTLVARNTDLMSQVVAARMSYWLIGRAEPRFEEKHSGMAEDEHRR